MSRGQDEFDERLRRALHDAADRVQPTDGGLDKIRRSLTRPRPVLLAGMMAACATAARRASGGLHTLMAWLPTVFAASASQRRPPPGGSRRRAEAGTALVTLLAAAVAVAGAFALTPALRRSLPGMAVGSHSLQGGGSAGGNAPRVNGNGGQLSPGSAAGAGPARHPPTRSAAEPVPCPATTSAPGPSASPAVSPGQTACTRAPASPSPSASPSLSPSGSPSPSESPTPPTSPSPSASPSPSESPSPSPTTPTVPNDAPSPSVTVPSPTGSPAYQGIFARQTLTNSGTQRGAAHIRPGRRSRHGHDGGLTRWQGRRHRQARHGNLGAGKNRPRGLGRDISRLAGSRAHHAPHARR
jgi:hypothetical protein